MRLKEDSCTHLSKHGTPHLFHEEHQSNPLRRLFIEPWNHMVLDSRPQRYFEQAGRLIFPRMPSDPMGRKAGIRLPQDFMNLIHDNGPPQHAKIAFRYASQLRTEHVPATFVPSRGLSLHQLVLYSKLVLQVIKAHVLALCFTPSSDYLRCQSCSGRPTESSPGGDALEKEMRQHDCSDVGVRSLLEKKRSGYILASRLGPITHQEDYAP